MILGCQRVLSPHCITIAAVNFFHFTLTMANSHILNTLPKVKKVNTFTIARKNEVNGMIQAYTSIKQRNTHFPITAANALPDVMSPTFLSLCAICPFSSYAYGVQYTQSQLLPYATVEFSNISAAIRLLQT